MAGAVRREAPLCQPLRRFLAGRWTLERRLYDRRAGWRGGLTGVADFTPEGETLHYREQGLLSLPQGAYRASRTLRYAFPEAHRAEVRFADGRLFHDLVLSAAPWRVAHLCGEDRYRGRFERLDDDAWRATWSVHGPRKQQRIVSLYRRA